VRRCAVSHVTVKPNRTSLKLRVASTLHPLRSVTRSGYVLQMPDTPYGQLLADPNPANQMQSRVVILYDGALDTAVEDYVMRNSLPAGFFKISLKYERFTDALAIPNNLKIYLFDQYSAKRWVTDGIAYKGMRSNQLEKLRNRTQCEYGK